MPCKEIQKMLISSHSSSNLTARENIHELE